MRHHPSLTLSAADPRRALEDTRPVQTGAPLSAPTLTLPSREEKVFFFFSSVFTPLHTPQPPIPLPCQLPGFRGVKACIIFHQLSVLISTKAAAMEQPLRLFAGLNFTDVRLLSFPRLNAAQRGWICKTNAAVCERESSGTKRPFQSADGAGESQHYADVKSIKNKSCMQKILSL